MRFRHLTIPVAGFRAQLSAPAAVQPNVESHSESQSVQVLLLKLVKDVRGGHSAMHRDGTMMFPIGCGLS